MIYSVMQFKAEHPHISNLLSFAYVESRIFSFDEHTIAHMCYDVNTFIRIFPLR